MKVFISLLLFLAVLTACASTPDECIALCDRIEQWAIQCKRPILTKGTCKNFYSSETQTTTAIRCWQKLLAWSPDMNAEFDCAKMPPELYSK